MKIGVIGLGSIGSRHAKNLLADGHEVIAYDPKMAPLPGLKKVFESDAIVICSPTDTHAEYLYEAVSVGKHIFVEKPIVGVRNLHNTYMSAAMLGAKEKNLVIFVGCMLRFHPCVIQTKKFLNENIIGTPYWAHFNAAQRNTKYKDSVTLNWGAHEIDLATHLLGRADVVHAALSGNPDTISDFVLNHNGVRSVVHLDYHGNPEWRGFTILGTEGRIACDLPRRMLFVHKEGRPKAEVSYFEGTWDNDYVAEINNFIGRIQGFITPGATGEEGLAVLRLIEEIQRMGGK